ncbi:MAG TPA: elongation factor Ts, partial [Patescibacteria group bacterium]|nr:elongation factor Ts [Patescibacteria group bacterium]
VSVEDVPEAEKKKVQAEFAEKVKAEGKPDNMIDQIVGGMVKKYFAEKCLLEQPYVKNPDQKVDVFVKENIAKLGENIVVKRFSRIALGEVE